MNLTPAKLIQLSILGSLCLGVGAIIGRFELVDIFVNGPISWVNLVISLPITLFSILLFHELGHLLVGIAQGFRFSLLVVGPLGVKQSDVDPENNQITPDRGITWFLNKDLSLYGGIAATEPVGGSAQLQRKFANIIIAGPIVSVTLSVVHLLIAWTTHSVFDFFLLIAGLGHFAIFLATTIPDKSGVFFSDRKRWQRLTGGGVEAQAELGLLHAQQIAADFGSLKCADPSHIHAITLDPSDFCQLLGHFYLWKYHRANNTVAQTNVAMEKLMSLQKKVSPSLWRLVASDEELASQR